MVWLVLIPYGVRLPQYFLLHLTNPYSQLVRLSFIPYGVRLPLNLYGVRLPPISYGVPLPHIFYGFL